MWKKLLAFAFPNKPTYQTSDQGFIEAWDTAIHMYGQVFSGITLIATTGGSCNINPGSKGPTSNGTIFSSPNIDCAAVQTILAHFTKPNIGGSNAKATQTSLMNASRNKSNSS